MSNSELNLKVYKAKSGDYMWDIARELFPNADENKAGNALNNMNGAPGYIYPGQILFYDANDPAFADVQDQLPLEPPPDVNEPEPEDEALPPMTRKEFVLAHRATFGARIARADFVIPYAYWTGNMNRSLDSPPENAMANPVSTPGSSARTKFDLARDSGHLPEGVEKPGMIWTIPLSWGVSHGAQNQNGNDFRALQAVVAVADGTHTAAYRTMFQTLADLSDRFEYLNLRLAHEHTGFWYPYPSGINIYFIGRTEVLTFRHENPVIQAIVRQIGVDGDLGPLFVRAWEEVAAQVRDILPQASISWNGTHSSAEPWDSESGDLKPYWNPNAMPDNQYVDAIGSDGYARAAMRNPENIDGWIRDACLWAKRFGVKKIEVPEYAICRALNDTNPKDGISDRRGAEWLYEYFRVITEVPASYGITVEHLSYFNRGRPDEKNGFRYGPDKSKDPLLWEALSDIFDPEGIFA